MNEHISESQCLQTAVDFTFTFHDFSNYVQAGDKITITFDPAVALTSFRLVSGNAEHPSDRFFNTTIEVPCLAYCAILICLQ